MFASRVEPIATYIVCVYIHIQNTVLDVCRHEACYSRLGGSI